MSQASKVLRTWVSAGQRGVHYWCQGCRGIHGVVIEGPGAWGFNGDFERPTFTPSVLTTGALYELTADGTDRDMTKPIRHPGPGGEIKHLICHTFVKDGMVQFLGDCGHEFAGQTLPLPELPDWLQDATPPPGE